MSIFSSGSPRILRSPKTPVKRAGSAIGKDTICLLRGTSLIGERCTFNVLQHVGLVQNMERLLDNQLNTNEIFLKCSSSTKITTMILDSVSLV